MMLKIGVVLAVAVLAAATASMAQASVPPLAPGSDWCGQAAGTCDSSSTYVECSDGSVWAIPSDWDSDGYGEAMCNGDYSVLVQPPPLTQLSQTSDGGTDVGLGADSDMAPNPSQYGTEVRCPDGSIWAVPKGVAFVCPAA